jgi:hypothetical protein
MNRPGHVAAAGWPGWLPRERVRGSRAGSPWSVTWRDGRGRGRVGWPVRLLATGFSIFLSGSVARSAVQARFSTLGSGFRPVLSSTTSSAVQSTVHVHPLPRGGRFCQEKRGGPPLSQVSCPINRDPSTHPKDTQEKSFEESKCYHYYS